MGLLAVDLGLRTGLALYGRDGRLVWHRSHNFGSQARLRRGAHGLLHELPALELLVLEGGGSIAALWAREGQKRGLPVQTISAETWRELFLLPREQTSGARAKRFAGDMARKVISWSGLPGPTALRHDAAEAVMAGLWGVQNVGWLPSLPPELRR